MVQFRAQPVPMPTPAFARGVDDVTLAALRRLVEGQAELEILSARLVDGPMGTPVYVVVVERDAEPLPGAGELQRRYGVTRREAEVALLVARRQSVAEMAATLGVTSHTVRRHVERVLGKLRVGRRQDVRPLLLELGRRSREAAEHVERLERVRRERRLQTAAA